MRDHLALMKSLGYRYDTQEYRLLRLDRFLQSRPDLNGQSLNVLIREWANTRSGPQQILDCHLAGRTLSDALSRIDRSIEAIPWEKRIKQAAHQRHRRPYVFSEQEVTCLFNTALNSPSTQSRLRPRTAHMMLVLAYCAGLRIGELARTEHGGFRWRRWNDHSPRDQILQNPMPPSFRQRGCGAKFLLGRSQTRRGARRRWQSTVLA